MASELQLSDELSPAALAALREVMGSDAPAELPEPLNAGRESPTPAPGPVQEQEIPTDNKLYKTHAYWEERFESEPEYDWLATWAALEPLLRDLLAPEHRILVVGCGNSTFSADLYNAGFRHVTNIDFAESVIRRMRALHADKPEMTWLQMDMLALDFPAASFDVVLDKAAMDALMCDEGDVWSPDAKVVDEAHRMCSGVARVLRPGGAFAQVSFAQPHFRRRYLEGALREPPADYGWALQPTRNLEVGLGYYVYVAILSPPGDGAGGDEGAAGVSPGDGAD